MIRTQGVFYLPRLARVKKARALTETESLLDLELKDGKPLGHRSGQFVLISRFGFGEVPISVCSDPDDSKSFQLCISGVGNVSRALAASRDGDWVGVRGPYGVGFPEQTVLGRDVILIAAGLGVAPLRSYIHHLLNRRSDVRRLVIVHGARHPSVMLFRDEVAGWADLEGVEVHRIVDQADESWDGPTGVVTDPLKQLDLDPDNTIAAAVAPPVAFRFVAAELLGQGVAPENIHFSLERNFHCGIGKCGHCQLNDVYVCQDGPVFSYDRLLGRTEAIEAWAPPGG
jgi:NAD(P)H-flavin reductase